MQDTSIGHEKAPPAKAGLGASAALARRSQGRVGIDDHASLLLELNLLGMPGGVGGVEALDHAPVEGLQAGGLRAARLAFLLELLLETLAEELLTTANLKLEEVAMRLGYAEPANFIHAFKRWKGVSPNAFREQHRAGQNG